MEDGEIVSSEVAELRLGGKGSGRGGGGSEWCGAESAVRVGFDCTEGRREFEHHDLH